MQPDESGARFHVVARQIDSHKCVTAVDGAVDECVRVRLVVRNGVGGAAIILEFTPKRETAFPTCDGSGSGQR